MANLLVAHSGGIDAFRAGVGRAIRRSFDLAYDGQHTGRYRWDELSKTEKTNIGSLVEIWLGRELKLTDGQQMDFAIAGIEFDCKFSGRSGGWMLPPEVIGHFALLITASDETGQMSVGVTYVSPASVSQGANRDLKSTLNRGARSAIHWIVAESPFPENTLLRIAPSDAVAVTRARHNGVAVSGQQRVDELFRRAQGRRISRNVIATVAQQDDFMKRVRSNGGSRSRLAQEGYLLLGHYQNHRKVAAALGVPVPDVGEIVSVRITPETSDGGGVEIDSRSWRLWLPTDPVVPAPALPHK